MKRQLNSAAPELLKKYLEQSDHGVLLLEQMEHGVVPIYANPAFERLSGYRLDEMRSHSLLRLLAKHIDRSSLLAIRAAIKMQSPLAIDAAAVQKSGRPFTFDVSMSPLFDERGRCTHWGVCMHDVTGRHMTDIDRRREQSEMQGRLQTEARERERAEQTLRYLTFHDVLTGLPNRSLLLQYVASALLEGRCGALFSVQLERFGAIAGALGHPLAEAVISRLSRLLREAAPDSAAVARLEGGTFAVWLPDVWQPAPTADVANAMLDCLAEPLELDHERISIRAHIGIAAALPGMYKTPEEVLRDAEIASHAAEKGHTRYRRFSPRLHESTLARLRVEFELHRAIARRQFVCHFQPIVQLSDRTVFGFEALARWQDPERGLVPPAVFIPVAEETGHIARIGEQVLEMAAREALRWPRLNGKALTVNVNVSRREFTDERFAAKVLKTLAMVGLDPEQLCLEITETAIATDEEAAAETLHALRGAGVAVAIDDFGIGYSSLGSLRRLPFTSVKIDRSFISASGDAEGSGLADEPIVEMIVALARARDMYICAEGVETDEQLRAAERLGCTSAQGYLIARPMPAEAAFAWIKEAGAA